MEPFVGEIRIFSFGLVPHGWAVCNGQLLKISENQALFSLIGNTYGGDGKVTFALPDLNGRVPVHPGNGIPRGTTAGEEEHILTLMELPAHTHQVGGDSVFGEAVTPKDRAWATSADKPFAAVANTTLSPSVISDVGRGQSHPNMQPYLVIGYCIALSGIYPPRS